MHEYMATSYAERLVCFSAASFFLINLVFGATVRLASPAAIRFASGLTPRKAARFILYLRMLPCGIAAFGVAALCLPSYLWLEPTDIREQVSFWCGILALSGALTLGISFVRAWRAWRETAQYLRNCWQNARGPDREQDWRGLLTIDSEAPVLAVAGTLTPQIVVSRRVMQGLSPRQLEAALGHERSHASARDNLKRFVMLLAPDVFPFCRALVPLDSAWARFSEWAADDEAAGEDAERSVSLASALVDVARMGLQERASATAVCFVADQDSLATRVERLLRGKVESDQRMPPLLLAGATMMIVMAAAAMLQPSCWQAAHRALEHLAR